MRRRVCRKEERTKPSLVKMGFAGRKVVVGHSIDLDHVAAHPTGALPAYADFA